MKLFRMSGPARVFPRVAVVLVAAAGMGRAMDLAVATGDGSGHDVPVSDYLVSVKAESSVSGPTLGMVSGNAGQSVKSLPGSGPALWPSGEDFESLRFSELNPDQLAVYDPGTVDIDHQGGEKGALDTLRLAAGLVTDGDADLQVRPDPDLTAGLVPSWGDLAIVNAPEPGVIPFVLVAGLLCAVALRRKAGY